MKEGARHLSRRDLFKIGAGAAVAGLTLRNPDFGENTTLDEIGHYSAESFGHNMYLKPAPFSGEYNNLENFEIDVVELDNSLLVAHTKSDAARFTPEEREYMNPYVFLKGCKHFGANPHLDIKKDISRKEKLIELLNEAASDFPKITVSSTDNEFLNALRQTDFAKPTSTGRILYTFSRNQYPQLRDFVTSWDNLDEEQKKGNYGTSLHFSLLTKRLVASLRERGLYTLSWTANQPSNFLFSLECGVNGITSDNISLFSHMRRDEV